MPEHLAWSLKEGLEKPLSRMGQRQLLPRGATRKDLAGSRPTPDLLLFCILVLQLPAKLQIYFCLPTEERMLQKDLEEDPFAVEVPFAEGDGID